jgi:hypothetical protein
MSPDDPLAEAKRRLPLPTLMAMLGYGANAKKSARCFFHNEKRPSFSVFQNGAARWYFHCFGCGVKGDEITFLELARHLTTRDAIAEFKRLARVAPALSSSDLVITPAPRRLIMPALHAGSDAELGALARLRHISVEGLRLASARGLLRFGRWRGRAAWFVTDDTGINAQVRRLDGQPWPQECKALTLPGARAAWPLGATQAAGYTVILFCEGGPDLIAAHHFVVGEHRVDDAVAVAMLGASLSIPSDALPHFAGKRIRFITHSDVAGRASVTRWAHQLVRAGARVDALALDGLHRADGSPAEDLNDLTTLHPQDLATHPALRRLIPKG